MADLRRFDLFASYLTQRFAAPRIWDVAGGEGKLNAALTRLGRDVTTFDVRVKRLPVQYAQRLLDLAEPCACDLLVGMHPDGATSVVIEYAARHRLPFAVVPCCSEGGLSYKPWLRHLEAQAQDRGFTVTRHTLPMQGRAVVIVGEPVVD
jgi:hypothetical protein